MEYLAFKELLKRSLTEAEVQSWIRGIFTEPEGVELSAAAEMEAVKAAISGYQEQIQHLTRKNKQYAAELRAAGQKMQGMQKEYSEYQDLFGGQMEVLRLYGRLSAGGREALQGVFSHPDPACFIASGTQPGNLDALWEYAKIQIMKRQYGDLEGLAGIIYYFIHLLNKTKNSSVYTLLEPAPGEQFDVEIHIRTSDSRPSGGIKRVLLKGYKNNHTNTVIKKSVVEL